MTGRLEMARRRLPALLVALALAMLWFGAARAPEARADTCPISSGFNPICEIYPDLSPDQQTNVADVANEIAQMPTGPPPPDEQDGAPTPTDYEQPDDPEPGPSFGIFEGDVAPVSTTVFVTQNAWTGLLGANVVSVYAGASGVDPSLGMIVVVTFDVDGTTIVATKGITAPTAHGALRVTTAVGPAPVLLLTAEDGEQFGYTPLADHILPLPRVP
jgi:hypothetical protein